MALHEQDPSGEPDTAATPAPHIPPVKSRRRGWLVLLLSFALLFAATAWLTGSRHGFALLWQALEYGSGGRLHVGRSEGTLWQGFRLEEVRWQDGKMALHSNRLALQWSPSMLWQGQLQIDSLQLGVVHYRQGQAEVAAPSLPSSLHLPLPVSILQLKLDSLQLGDQPPLLRGLSAAYFYQQGQHALALQQVDSPWGRLSASAALAAAAPFALSGQLEYHGRLEGVAADGVLHLQGTLAAPRLHGTLGALGLSAVLDAHLQPFAPQALQRLQQLDVRVGGINPYSLNPAWPQARLGLALQLAPAAGGRINGAMSLINYRPGPVSEQQLPLSLLHGAFTIRDNSLQLDNLQAQMAEGTMRVNGRLSPSQLALTLHLDEINSRALYQPLPAHRISGDLQLGGSMRQPQLDVALRSEQLALRGRVRMPANRQWQLEKVQLQTGVGKLLLDGLVALDTQKLSLTGQLIGLNPSRVSPRLPVGNVNGRFQASLQGMEQGQLQLQLSPGTLSGAALSGKLDGRWQGRRLLNVVGKLQLGGNSLLLNGAYGVAGDRLRLQLDAPQLGLLGPAFGGRLQGDLLLSGVPARPQLQAELSGSSVRLPGGVMAESLKLSGESGAQRDSPFRLQLDGRAMTIADWHLDQLRLQADGRRAAHQLQLQVDGHLEGAAQSLQLQLAGGLDEQSLLWRGSLQQLRSSGKLALQLLQPVSLQASAANVALGASRWQALGAQWQLADSGWQRATGWHGSGSVQALALSSLAPWLQLPWRQTLQLDGSWQLSGQQGWPQGRVQLQRSQGDVWLPATGGEQALGLRQLTLDLGLGELGPFALALESRLGSIRADGQIGWGNGQNPAAAALSGNVQLRLPSLALAQAWLKPGMELGGSVNAALQLGGSVQSPLLDGTLRGEGLRFVERRQGIRLEDGQLLGRLSGQQLLIDSLRFGKQNELTGSGRMALSEATPEMQLLLKLDQFPALARPGRRLLLSGQSRIDIRQQEVTLTGQLKVDEGRIELPKLGGPRLSDDVHVAGRELGDGNGQRWPLAVDLQLALGDKLRFGGNGLDAWLGGDVRLLAEKGGPLQARGQIRIDKGRFKAYGQDLDITRGLISFSGALDNPVLDVRARRRSSPVGAGVELSGALLAPTVKLVADEAMSDKDKLSWLVLGRAAALGEKSGQSAEATAGGMLAGLVNDQLGLFDDVGVLSRPDSHAANGTLNAAEQVVTLGKQLTRELYVGYEYGLRSAEQALKISYQLSRGFSLVGRAARDSSSELRYTFRFD